MTPVEYRRHDPDKPRCTYCGTPLTDGKCLRCRPRGTGGK